MGRRLQTSQKQRLPKQHWPNQTKLEAVKLWLVSGNLAAVGTALGVPYLTLQHWKKQQWWEEWVNQMKLEGKVVLSNRLRDIASKALMATEDRLDHGDYVLNGKGDLIRKPVTAAVANKVAIDMINSVQKLEQEDTTQQEKALVDRLSDLATKFEEMSKKKKKVQVTDVIIGEEIAIYDQSKSMQSVWKGESEDETEIP